MTIFRRCVARYDGERKIKRFTCVDQFLCLAFAQLTWRETLRDMVRHLLAQEAAGLAWCGLEVEPSMPMERRRSDLRVADSDGNVRDRCD